MKRLVLHILIFIASLSIVRAQTYNMNNTTVSGACSGTFYDSGGSGGNYSNNESYTKTFCASAGQYVSFNFTSFNTESGYDFLYVYDGANTSAPIIGCYTGTSSPGTIASSIAGGCLTFVFTSDGSTTKAGWAATISCSSTAPALYSPLQAPCTNLGFESGLSGWFGTTGVIIIGATGAATPVYGPTAANTYGTQTTIMTAGTDPVGLFSTVFAGSQSVRLGDGTGTGALGASIEQYFQVTTSNSNFTYNYAVVLEDGGHPNNEQPFFKVEMWDQNGNSIACANYIITAPGTGFIQSTVSPYNADTYYKKWTTVSVNLLSYIGQNVKVRFTSGDCDQGGHFGYAYVDCSCAPYTINTPTICVGQSATLIAPSGALSYAWSPGGATTTSITVSPASTTNYSCTLTSQGTTPCAGTITTTVTVIPTPTITVNTATVCSGSSVSLTANGATTYSWTPATGLSATTGSMVTANPTSNTTYSIVGTTGTCSSSKTTVVTVSPTPTVAVNSATVCSGNSAVLTATGATTYSWTPSTGLSAATGANVTANPTVTTTYTVVGTTGTCTSSAISIVNVNANPTVTVNNPSICAGSTATLTASGATTYTWTTGVTPTSGSVVTTSPGSTTSYTVKGTTGTCTNTAVATVSIAPSLSLTATNPTTCSGVSTNITVSGATTYSWTPATNLSATTGSLVTVNNPTTQTVYTITGTSGTCTGTTTSTVSIAPSLSIMVNNATICAGTSATLSASGGTTYSWTPSTNLSATTGSVVTANPATTTTYVVTGNTNGCVGTATSVVTISPNPVVTVNSPTVCAGSSVTLTPNGATTYSWSTGATTNPITVSPTSTTSFTVTGTTATCTNTAVATVTVVPNPTVTVNSTLVCVGTTATLTAAGATSYSWSTGAITNSITASPPIGTTSFTVTGTSNTCTNTAVATVTVVSTPTVTVSSPTICIGSVATLTVNGAATYSWSTGATTNPLTISPATTTTYTVVGTAGTCTASGTGVVTVNPLPTVTATSGTICVGQQTATLTASGASTYTWGSAADLSSSIGTSVVANPTSTENYTITGTDANGCVNTGTTSVTVLTLPTITATTGTICLGQQTATLTASGASTYTWSSAADLSSSTGSSVIANPSSTETYTITGTDAKGCVNTGTTSVLVNVLPTVTASSASVCPNNAGTITAGGANTYTWSTPGVGASLTQTPVSTTTYTVSGTDVNTCTNTAVGTITVLPTLSLTVNNATICVGQQTATLTVSGASTYAWNPTTGLAPTTGSVVVANPSATTIYTITGSVGTCTAITTSTVTVNQLPTITAISGTICAGQQTTTLTASGGTTYTWAPTTGLAPAIGGTVVANPSSTQNYTITGTDANGCVNTGTASVLVNSLPNVTATSTSVCPGNAGAITASGANTYTWSTPGVGASLTQTPATTTVYTVTGTDVNTCTNTAIGTINVYNAFGISVNSAAICAAGQQTATLTANGASTYVWNPSTGLSASTGSVVTTIPSATSIVYTVTGTSAVGNCTATATSTLTINALPLPTVTSNTPCASQQTLSLNCLPNGLTTYIWSGPNSFISSLQNPTITTASVTAAAAGVYTVAVVDANQCTNSTTVNVMINPLPVVTASASPVCVNQMIQLSASGGVSYSWSGQSGAFTSSLQNPTIPNATATMSGVYVVTVTDAKGCVNANVAQVLVNPTPTVTVNSSTICVGQQTATLTASGASTYSWSPANTLSSSSGATVFGTPSSTTNYTVTGINGTGCVSTATANIFVNTLPVVITNTIAPDCIPLCTAFSATSTPAASSYTWSFGNGIPVSTQPSPTQCFTLAGTYQVKVIVTDIHGCNGAASTPVHVFAIPVADFDYGQQPVSVLAPEVQFTNQSTPGLPYYSWNFGDIYGNDTSSLINPWHTYTDVGTYYVTLTVSTVSGCSAKVVKPIVINEDYALYVPNAFSPNSDDKNETFKAVGEGITEYKLYVFDRWGLLLFYSDDINKGWDGTIQGSGGEVVQQDVYVWKIQATDFRNKHRNLHGTVTLLK